MIDQALRLAIADPPYPPLYGPGGFKPRASRWYGDNQRSRSDRPSDFHPEAYLWDDLATHKSLIERLDAEFDGFALATAPDGIAAYWPLPAGVRIMSWVKPNAQPGAHRLRSTWEPVILKTPTSRVSNRDGRGSVDDSLVCPVPGGFIGRKPAAWVRWVVAAMGWRPGDSVEDLFGGSGAVADALDGMVDRFSQDSLFGEGN